ncbi:hypothetical protein E4Z66_14250 [Aliishimia ponticola]|uniref:Uncharacterized protein n=2 Tax=Aliishimia ponticola TaxID=2499833 RepID=A0A4S4NC46_9RHOB|nr:hypothetical protein E4Z66_14250 [Aliishimia ponticola]
MPTNRGKTSLKCKRRATNPMREHDQLPPELRQWVAGAMLPWRAGSVRTAYRKALARTGDSELALRELDRMQKAQVARDVGKVWGADHPQAACG